MKKWIASTPGLIAAVFATAVILTVGCSKKEAAEAPASAKQKVVVYNWTEYLPESALQAFTKETGID